LKTRQGKQHGTSRNFHEAYFNCSGLIGLGS
jgi:hypothetical protein